MGIAIVDLLARLQLAARRAGYELRIVETSTDVAELVLFAGLEEVLRVEVKRQAEEREEPRRVEEERELGDLPA